MKNVARLQYVEAPASTYYLLLVAGLTSAIFGIASAIFPWWFVIAIAVSIIFLVGAILFPVGALIFVVGITCGLVNDTMLPKLHVFGGTIQASDLGLVLASVSCIVRYRKDIRPALKSLSPVIYPLVLFLLFVFVSAIRSLLELGIPIKDVLGESKHFIYWVLVPVFAVVGVNRDRFNGAVSGLLILASLFATGQIGQGIFGVPIFSGNARLEDLDTLGVVSESVLRSITQGVHFLVWGLLLCQVFLATRTKKRLRLKILSVACIAALFLTFGRAVWAGTFLAICFISFRLGLKPMVKSTVFMIVVGISALALVFVARPGAIQAGVERALSVREEVSHGSSLAWRYYENEIAWKHIKSSPLFGIGLGSSYRPPAQSDVVAEQVRYVHNAYLYLLLKGGLVALGLFLVFIYKLIWVTFRLTKSPDTFFSSLALAWLATFIAYFLASFTQPEFMFSPGISFVALTTGLACAAHQSNSEQKKHPL